MIASAMLVITEASLRGPIVSVCTLSPRRFLDFFAVAFKRIGKPLSFAR